MAVVGDEHLPGIDTPGRQAATAEHGSGEVRGESLPPGQDRVEASRRRLSENLQPAQQQPELREDRLELPGKGGPRRRILHRFEGEDVPLADLLDRPRSPRSVAPAGAAGRLVEQARHARQSRDDHEGAAARASADDIGDDAQPLRVGDGAAAELHHDRPAPRCSLLARDRGDPLVLARRHFTIVGVRYERGSSSSATSIT